MKNFEKCIKNSKTESTCAYLIVEITFHLQSLNRDCFNYEPNILP